jgi:hypothetical protein
MAFKLVRTLVLGIDSDDGSRALQPAPYFTAGSLGLARAPVRERLSTDGIEHCGAVGE